MSSDPKTLTLDCDGERENHTITFTPEEFDALRLGAVARWEEQKAHAEKIEANPRAVPTIREGAWRILDVKRSIAIKFGLVTEDDLPTAEAIRAA